MYNLATHPGFQLFFYSKNILPTLNPVGCYIYMLEVSYKIYTEDAGDSLCTCIGFKFNNNIPNYNSNITRLRVVGDLIKTDSIIT